MTHERIEVPPSGTVVVRIAANAAQVDVVADDVDHVEVDAERGQVEATPANDREPRTEVKVAGRSAPISVVCPRGSDIVVALGSGRVALTGEFGSIRATSRNGSIEVEEAESLDARTGSGSIVVARCRGTARVMTRNGKISVGATLRLHASSKSGRIEVDSSDQVDVHTGSGRLKLGVSGKGAVKIRSIAGSIKVAVSSAALPTVSFKTRKGSLRNEIGEGDDFDLDVRTLSGSVSVARN